MMVYSVLNCLYRCYQLPSRVDSSNTSGNGIDRDMGNIICDRCSKQIRGLLMVSTFIVVVVVVVAAAASESGNPAWISLPQERHHCHCVFP